MNEYNYEQKRIAVIGGGPAGMMSAGVAYLYGARVTLFEGMGRLGKKLAITGKGRCNVTNACTLSEFLDNVPTNPRFLYAALSAFTTEDTMNHFKELGVALKVERGRRVFPESDRAGDIVGAMKNYVRDVEKVFEKVTAIEKLEDGTFSVIAKEEYIFDAVILATGGKSYPLTGSDGSGYKLARRLGHTVTPLSPSLVPLESPDALPRELQGLSLKNVGIRICRGEREIYTDFGEMLFTHFGLSGPLILSASSHLRKEDFADLTLYIDLKPALDEKTLDRRLLSDFAKYANRDFINALNDLLPSKLIPPLVRLSGIPERTKVNLITKEERQTLLRLIKALPVRLSSFRPIEEAIVTSGGIAVGEIKPGTMESKIVPGLYFAGEVIDVDAYTGGYNLQIAFSTGYLAGKSAAEF